MILNKADLNQAYGNISLTDAVTLKTILYKNSF